MKTGPLERVPPQLSNFHTKVNSKSTWLPFFFFFLLFVSPHSLSLSTLYTEQISMGSSYHTERKTCFMCAGLSTLFIPLWSASDFTAWLPPNSTCLTSNSSLWVVLSLSPFFLLAPTSFWKLLKRKCYFYPLQYKVCRSITPLGKS